MLVLVMANCHYDLSVSSGARPQFGPYSVPCLMLQVLSSDAGVYEGH